MSPIKASGSYRECLATGSISSRLVARGPAPVTRLPGSVPGTCFAGSRSSQSPPFAPPAPPPVARLCSLASSLLWRSQTSRVRASSASTPRLPDADPRYAAAGQTRDLPVPAQRASTHARVLDHAGSGRGSRYRLRPCCLPYFRTRRHPRLSSFRGSMAGLCAPLPTLRRHPRECQRTARGRCGSLLLHRGGLSPPTPCRSSRRTESLAHPGGNITGCSLLAPETTGKILSLLKQAVPPLQRVAVLWNSANPALAPVWQATDEAARSIGLTLLSQSVGTPEDFAPAFDKIALLHPDAVLILIDSLAAQFLHQIAEFTVRERLPAASSFRPFAALGGLLSYGPSRAGIERDA